MPLNEPPPMKIFCVRHWRRITASLLEEGWSIFSQHCCDKRQCTTTWLLSRMLLSELYKIIVNKVTFSGFREGDRPPLDPPPTSTPFILRLRLTSSLIRFYYEHLKVKMILNHITWIPVCFNIMFRMINKRALLVEVWWALISLIFYLFQNNFASFRSPKWVLFRPKRFILEALLLPMQKTVSDNVVLEFRNPCRSHENIRLMMWAKAQDT